MDERILKMMRALDITEDEAKELLAEDEEIDRKPMSKVDEDLSAEQRQVKKSYTQADRKKTERKTPVKREKDAEKVEILQKICDFLGENAEISNPGQSISLKVGENCYSLTLTKHRIAKN